MRLPRALAPLRHRRYAALWTGAFASNIGTWMESVAVGVLVTTTTGQAGWAGLVAAAAFVPNALLGPLGGALADRVPRRALLLGTTAVQAMLAAGLTALAAFDAAEPWAVTLIVLASGCAGALGFPAYQSMMPDLVPREDLTGAVALGAAQWNLGRVIGPVLAGVVIALGGYEWAFAVNTVSFLAVIVAIAPIRLPAPSPTAGESIATAIRDGARYARREAGIRAVMTYLAINSLFAAPFIALIPAVALKVFDNEEAGTAALVTAQGVGAVLMALGLGILTARWGHRHVLLGLITVLPGSLILYAIAPTLELAVVAIALVGAVYLGCLSSFMTIAQLRAPNELRGRVMSAIMVLLGTLYPIGSVLQGAIADEIGLRATTVGAALILAGAFFAIRVFRPGFDHALGDPEEAGPPELAPEPAVG
ncbi:MAG TPA: MFS transporter [Acidimicrobiia bacterium]|nr:MFS transporter [Acidimicrobiia bacterium]